MNSKIKKKNHNQSILELLHIYLVLPWNFERYIEQIINNPIYYLLSWCKFYILRTCLNKCYMCSIFCCLLSTISMRRSKCTRENCQIVFQAVRRSCVLYRRKMLQDAARDYFIPAGTNLHTKRGRARKLRKSFALFIFGFSETAKQEKNNIFRCKSHWDRYREYRRKKLFKYLYNTYG